MDNNKNDKHENSSARQDFTQNAQYSGSAQNPYFEKNAYPQNNGTGYYNQYNYPGNYASYYNNYRQYTTYYPAAAVKKAAKKIPCFYKKGFCICAAVFCVFVFICGFCCV